MSHRQLVIFGNPENRRVVMFCDAARSLGFPKPRVIAYEAILAGGVNLADAIPVGSVVRIESPGENAQVERDLIAAGAKHSPCSLSRLTASQRHRFPEFANAVAFGLPSYEGERGGTFGERTAAIDHGRIDSPQLWYMGFSDWLRKIEEQLAEHRITWMNHPDDIALMFDKLRCQQELRRHGIPVPKLLGTIDNYADLRLKMGVHGVSRVFVKLLYGSSASGVVAFQTSGPRVLATTSVEMISAERECKLYNSLRLHKYDRERDVAELIDELCSYGAYAEMWLPKAGWRGKTYDLRIVVIAGQVRHTVMRTSQSPLTNLHLGNARGKVAELLESLPSALRERSWETCQAVANAFPRSLYCGIDLMFTPQLDKHAVLEVNAFGDLLPNVLCDGLDTYGTELHALDRGLLSQTRDRR